METNRFTPLKGRAKKTNDLVTSVQTTILVKMLREVQTCLLIYSDGSWECVTERFGVNVTITAALPRTIKRKNYKQKKLIPDTDLNYFQNIKVDLSVLLNCLVPENRTDNDYSDNKSQISIIPANFYMTLSYLNPACSQ